MGLSRLVSQGDMREKVTASQSGRYEGGNNRAICSRGVAWLSLSVFYAHGVFFTIVVLLITLLF